MLIVLVYEFFHSVLFPETVSTKKNYLSTVGYVRYRDSVHLQNKVLEIFLHKKGISEQIYSR